MHTPKRMLRDGADTVVIFIHGLMGTPDQFGDIMDAVYARGASAVSLLLPGHGGTGFDFAKSSVGAWERHVRAEAARYQSSPKIYLVGHSIGGLLALNLAAEIQVSGVAALSTPLRLFYLDPRANFRRLRLLLYGKKHPVGASYRKANSIGKPYYRAMPFWLRALSLPRELIRKTKPNLENVTAPTLLIHSERDETVSPKSARMLRDLLVRSECKAVTLKESRHAYYTEAERNQIIEEIVALICPEE